MEFEKCKLRDIADVMISGVDKKSNNDETPVRLCNFVDVYRNWAITSSLHDTFMQATAKQIEIDRFLLHKGQVAITKDSETRNDIGIATYIADDFDDVILGYHCALITPNNELVDSKYLNAFLHSNYILRYFELNATGSGMRYTLSNDTILNMPILLPSIEQQKAIGRVFSNIDKQIETLNSINRNLEQLARQLYDYWFVQFDFPNDEGKPYKSSGGEMVWNEKLKRCIPKDCLLKKIGEILDKVPKSIRLSTKEYNAKGDFPIVDQSSDKYIVGYTDEETAVVKKYPAILFGDHSCVVKYLNFEFCRGADGTQILYSANTRIPLEYLYFAVKDIKFKEGYARHYSILKDNLIIVPEEKVAAGFEIRVKPIFNSIKDNIFEIISLQRLRDELLPMLLNGQVSVYDIKSYDFMPEDIQMAAEP